MSTQIELATQSAALAEFDPARFNVIQPVVSIVAGNAASPYLAQSVSTVTIDPDEERGEVYTEPRYASGQKRALSSLGLKKIADAAGIRFLPTEVVDRERWIGRDGYRHARLHVRAGGAIRMLNGEWAVEFAEKEIDTEDWTEQLREAKVRKAERDSKAPDTNKIESDVRRDLLAFREHLLSHAETRARSRLIRRVLSLPQVFTVKELGRPFAVPRLVFRPDLAGAEEIGRIAIIGDVSLNGTEAIATLYGRRGNADLPALARELEPDVELDKPELGAGVSDEPAKPKPARKASGGSRMGKARAAETVKDPAADDSGEPPSPDPEPVGLPDEYLNEGPYKGKHLSELSADELLDVASDEGSSKRRQARAKAWADRRK